MWTTSRKGIPELKIRCMCEDPIGDPIALYGSIYFSDKAMWMVRLQLAELGFDCDADFLGDIKDGDTFVGKKLVVVIDEYKGILKIGRFGSEKKEPPTEEALKKTTDLLREAGKEKEAEVDDAPLGEEIPF